MTTLTPPRLDHAPLLLVMLPCSEAKARKDLWKLSEELVCMAEKKTR